MRKWELCGRRSILLYNPGEIPATECLETDLFSPLEIPGVSHRWEWYHALQKYDKPKSSLSVLVYTRRNLNKIASTIKGDECSLSISSGLGEG
jgi:hypothetical protein